MYPLRKIDGLRFSNSILLPTLMYALKTWTYNREQQLRLCAVEMRYLRGACGVTMWESENNEKVYDECSMGSYEVKCGVMEWIKRNTLRLFGHLVNKKSEKFVEAFDRVPHRRLLK